MKSEPKCGDTDCLKEDYFHYYNCNSSNCDFHLQVSFFYLHLLNILAVGFCNYLFYCNFIPLFNTLLFIIVYLLWKPKITKNYKVK